MQRVAPSILCHSEQQLNIKTANKPATTHNSATKQNKHIKPKHRDLTLVESINRGDYSKKLHYRCLLKYYAGIDCFCALRVSHYGIKV